METHRDRFLGKLRASLAEGAFVKLTLSAPTPAAEPGLKNLYARLVALREGPRVQCVWRCASRDVTKNLAPAEAPAQLGALLGAQFEVANLFTTSGDWRLRCAPDGRGALKGSRPAFPDAPALAHDAPKAAPLAADAPWLRALGVTNPAGQPRPGMADKLRQIQRYAEILGHLLDGSPLADRRTLHVADMGAGKGYLTFALAELLAARGFDAEITGVELRAELVEASNRIAREAGFARLRFVAGDIASFQPAGALDILIALHACDTATDDALHRGLAARAALIVCAPCCHQELRPQMATPAALEPILRHGILAERTAESLTDGLRALLLEINGYEARVFEFIALEHTGKNVMIAATRRAHPRDPAPLRARLRETMQFFGLREQRLARLLGEQ